MKLFEVKNIATLKIKEKGLEEYPLRLIIEEVFNYNYHDYLLNSNIDLDLSKESRFFNILDEYLENKRPIQYILGYTYFMGLKLKVDERVLIPRQDSEEVVYFALKQIKENNYKSFVDLGSGSGNIALALKSKLDYLEATSVDISLEALKLSKENKELLNLDVEFMHSDMLEEIIKQNRHYDLIISNPPYIAYDSKDVEDIVKNNEPHLALFAADNGLYFYKKIINDALKVLNPKGSIVFEIGFDQREALERFVKDNYLMYDVKTFKDLNGLDRIMHLKLKA